MKPNEEHNGKYLRDIFYIIWTLNSVPVVELVDVLDVAKDNVVLVAEARWDVLWAASHLPQVCLEISINFMQKIFKFSLFDPMTSLESV